ncbi:MAG: dTDP-4-dehydrorhamnose reductase, partial [Oscillatoria sp. PMC 1068.18]|nr:dTDP-4-dehydrorhamnose reductase [Oscillatoria sp. PMC 1076.18]MEC4990779.1 dTDP-4-dehydrorhamnose reductase [Oscillatoria sp. PMC 1068.18]
GKTGQLGQELTQIVNSSKNKIIAVGRKEIDLTETEKLGNLIKEIQPKVIINAAAYTAVDKAESEANLAKKINTDAPEIMAQAAQKLQAFLIHVSTDYVFDGQKNNPYQETDLTKPINVYGETKLAGEEAIKSACENYLILRTAWVYGNQGQGNFVKTMLKLGAAREEIRVVADQIGSPTWTKDLASTITNLIPHLSPEIAGIYHYTNSGVASWYDFAVAIFEEAKLGDFLLKIERVVPITTSEYPTPAKRPAYSVLNCAKIRQILGTYPPHWRQSLREMLKQELGREK